MQSLLASNSTGMVVQKATGNRLVIEEWIGDNLVSTDSYKLRTEKDIKACAAKRAEYIAKYGDTTAKQLGAKGGQATAKKGKEYMAELGRKGAEKRWANKK